MPAKAAHPGARQRVERADEQRVEERAFPAAVKPRFHWKTLLYDADGREPAQQRTKLTEAVFPQDRRVLVFERNLHYLRQCIQPGHAVVDLEDCRSSGSHNTPAFLDQFPIVRGVLDDAVSVDEIE